MGNPLSYTKKYKTYDQFMAKIEDDLSTYADQGFIESDKYIDVVEECNAFLSVKINPTRPATLEIVNYKTKLPCDFKLWNRGFICDKVKSYETPKTVDKTTECNTCLTCNTCEGVCNHIIVTTEKEVLVMDRQIPLILTHPHYSCDSCENPLYGTEVSIERDGDDLYLLTGFKTGKIVITYVTDLISTEDIVIYDHPLVRGYYEYAVKEAILEDIWMNGKEEVKERYRFMSEKHRQSKINAKRFVNTPDFNEIRSYYKSKRARAYDKYFTPILTKRPKHSSYITGYPSYTDIYKSTH